MNNTYESLLEKIRTLENRLAVAVSWNEHWQSERSRENVRDLKRQLKNAKREFREFGAKRRASYKGD